MTAPTIFDGATHREMTAAELAQYKKDNELHELRAAEIEQQKQLRKTALQKLFNLGLSHEEIIVLVGGNWLIENE